MPRERGVLVLSEDAGVLVKIFTVLIEEKWHLCIVYYFPCMFSEKTENKFTNEDLGFLKSDWFVLIIIF
jgi:hypothetical protein